MGKWVVLAVLLHTVLAGCEPSHVQFERIRGPWLFELDLGGQTLPFHVRLEDDSAMTVFSVFNGGEHIRAEQVVLVGDSLHVRLPVFNTAIHACILSDSTLSGVFVDYSRQAGYSIPLKGRKGVLHRFPQHTDALKDLSGRWSVGFSPNSSEAYPAIGEFRQDGNNLTGTFLTTTGDFRFLEGVVSGDSLFLSGFDGAHALLFKAQLKGDSIVGSFWSGTHWFERWKAVRNPNVRLPDPELLTALRPGHSRLEFSFPELNGQMVTHLDERFRGNVVIVQVMGSWCPNCLDETTYLVDLYNRSHADGLEVVALAFERGRDDVERLENLKRLRNHFPVTYTMLLAGSANKSEAAEKLPMLNHVVSFPTTIFIDRRGRVRRILTGFSGPGTGQHYIEFTSRTEELVNQLLEEKVVF